MEEQDGLYFCFWRHTSWLIFPTLKRLPRHFPTLSTCRLHSTRRRA